MRPNLYRGAAGVLFGFLLVFVLAASPVYGGGGPIPGFSFNQVTACPGKVIVDYHYQPGQSSVPTFHVIVRDSGLGIIGQTDVSATVGNSVEISIPLSPSQTIGSSLLVEISYSSLNNATNAVVVNCTEEGGHVSLPCFDDGRLDPYYCAAPVAMYLSEDDDGWMLQVWKIDEDSQGSFLFTIYDEDLPEPGDKPILLAQDGAISLYLLPTGELQINAPFVGEPFKFYVFIFEVPGGEGYHANFP